MIFWLFHFELLGYTIALVALTVFITRWLYRRKAIREANSYLKQRIVEARIQTDTVQEQNEKLQALVMRLAVAQGIALSAAKSIEEAHKEVTHV